MTAPYVVYGADASYYTGKLEAYLRAKGIAYELRPFTPSGMRRCARHTGVVQIPQVECPDGTWLVDTTLIIDYFERRQPEPSVMPADGAARFVSLLLEDYADEWLWRPAMHYRWSYRETARLMSGRLAEHLAEMPGPMFVKRAYWRLRQQGIFVVRDGVRRATRGAVEASYRDTLDALETVFRARPYVMGERPTPADFGFFASMFRHFGCDPTPARIMRARAPGVYEWVARLWNIAPHRFADRPQVDTIAADLKPLLEAVASVYLPYLEANAAAFAAGDKRLEVRLQGVDWREPVKPYRVWCLQRLRGQFAALDAAARARVTDAVGAGAAAALSRVDSAPVVAAIGELPIAGRTSVAPVDSWWR